MPEGHGTESRIHKIEIEFDFKTHMYKVTGSNIAGFTLAAHNFPDVVKKSIQNIRRLFDDGADDVVDVSYKQAAGPVLHGTIGLRDDLSSLNLVKTFSL